MSIDEIIRNMYHGTATSKIDIEDIVKVGDKGIVTAYLPDEKIFAIFFTECKEWLRFDITEKEFHEQFDVVNEMVVGMQREEEQKSYNEQIKNL